SEREGELHPRQSPAPFLRFLHSLLKDPGCVGPLAACCSGLRTDGLRVVLEEEDAPALGALQRLVDHSLCRGEVVGREPTLRLLEVGLWLQPGLVVERNLLQAGQTLRELPLITEEATLRDADGVGE